jgi:sugar lactone lactonase YvrE
MTNRYQAVAATDAVYELAEGVVWDDRAQLIRWVDIWKGRVLSGKLDGARIADIQEIGLGQTTGAVALAEDGGLLVAAARGLATISTNGDISFGPDLLGDRTGVRLNDGSADMYGAFLVGTMSLGEATGDEVLLRVWPNGRVETLREGLGLSNGIAFSPNGNTIYYVDTLAGTVSAHSYGSANFDRSEPWVPVPCDLPASPDGLTIDADGALWVAQWGGSSVRRHAPSGELLAVVTVDAAQASCPGFVGPGLDLLAITTAQEGLDTFTDRAGTIFLADVGATGLPAPRWAGGTTTPYWLLPERDEK